MLLHWLTALLLFVAAGLALFREAFGSLALTMITVHKAVGLAILVVAVARLGWRLAHPPPPHEDDVPRWERRLANGVHRTLYLLLIAVPLTGWVFTSYAPAHRPMDYRGGYVVPRLPVPTDDRLSLLWHEAHELMGFALVGLMLLHLAGVARRQLVLGTPALGRMTARGWPRGLAGLTILAAGMWLVGLGLDLLDIRLLGDPATRGS